MLVFVGAKLVGAEVIALDQLVLIGHYGSRSAALRAGLGLLFEKHGLKPEQDKAIEAERRRHRPRDRRQWGAQVHNRDKLFTNKTARKRGGT